MVAAAEMAAAAVMGEWQQRWIWGDGGRGDGRHGDEGSQHPPSIALRCRWGDGGYGRDGIPTYVLTMKKC